MRRFTLKPEHLTLLRAANVDWNGDEFGAPSIDPKRPYGNGDVLSDIERLLHPEESIGELEISDDELAVRYETYEQLHRELKTALQIVLATGSFVAGEYVLEKDYTKDWVLAAPKSRDPLELPCGCVVNDDGIVVGQPFVSSCTHRMGVRA